MTTETVPDTPVGGGSSDGQPPAATETAGARWGRELRLAVSRSSHAAFEPPAGRDPVGLLEAGNAGRVAALIPIRFGRMATSPFSFFRGSAALMAGDLAATPVSGIVVQLCGDAHLSNFGLYASAERRLVFGVNDFDETMRGPWEWDVKRLAASLVVAARQVELTSRQAESAATAAVASYREHMATFAAMRHVDVWYATVDATSMTELLRSARARRTARTAQQRDHLRALDRLTEEVGGVRRIRHAPPLVLRVDEDPTVAAQIDAVMAAYRQGLPEERRILFDRYRLADVAMKVVGVGSVGTHCWIGLLHGRDDTDPLFLQVKEARPSVLEVGLGPAPHVHHGERVVVGQRLMQAFPDVFLGWTTAPDSGRHYYVRQLQDMKGSFRVETMPAEELVAYARLCGRTLARSHARSGDAAAISGYLGSSDTFERAVAAFARSYADQNERDHALFVAAAASGRINAAFGV
jgi:uncharacterized protein (DUF2252 family)